jgi:integrase
LPDLGEAYQPRTRWLPPEELELLVEELAEIQPHYAGAVAFAVASGARRAEIARATRADLEQGLATGMLPIRGSKTAKASRPVAVLSIFRPWLERALSLARPDGAAFGSWVLLGNARREILASCQRAQIAPATWNDLRRTHGRWLRRAGVDVELIGEQLRHTSPTMARRVYAQITPEEIGEQIEARLCPPAVRTGQTPTGSNGS